MLLKKITHFFGIEINRKAAISKLEDYYKNQLVIYQKLINSGMYSWDYGLVSYSGIVFSKNRAIQLKALLESYFIKAINPAPLFVLYTITDVSHKKSYEELIQLYSKFPVKFVEQNDFRTDLLEIINSITTNGLFFLTDDGIFIREFDFSDFSGINPLRNIISLRHGIDLDYCYNLDHYQPVPILEAYNNVLFTWQWDKNGNSPDWSYPLSVDGHMFLKTEIEIILSHIFYSAPNSLEANLQVFNPIFFKRKGMCYNSVIFVNIPVNIVQNEIPNRITYHYSSDDLLEIWNNGFKINIEVFKNKSMYELKNLKYEFLERK